MAKNSSRLAEVLKDARLAWRLYADRRVPMALKLVPVLSLVYVLSPIDLVPDVFPVVGQLDDLAVVLRAVKLFIDLAPDDIVAEHAPDTVSTSYRVRD